MPHPEAVAVAPLTETAHAKINLALHVRARRNDGYHQLESLFAFAQDGDLLRAERADALSLTVEGPFASALAGEGDNLILRAARALRQAYGVTAGASMTLDKRLPVASGIGGGSADAAAALRLLIRLWGLDPPRPALHDLALGLGSDVPACLDSRTCMVGGRGEEVAAVALDGVADTPILLVNPGIAVSTGPVFAGWDRIDRGGLRVDKLAALTNARSDLESSAISIAPAIADVLAALRQRTGVILSRMSGSGATCFALFDRDTALYRAADAIRAAHPGWWCMETRLR